MSSFQRAREALGHRLREMRQEAHLTGRQVATVAGWAPSKISKLEGGKQTPTCADLEAWARICEEPAAVPELVASLRSLEEQYVEHRRMHAHGMATKQHSIAELEARTLYTRNFEPAAVPGLLQTAEYARYRIAEGEEGDVERGMPASEEDLAETVATRMARQQQLYKPGKRFHFVMTEAVLRYTVCPVEVMEGQLGQLVSLTTLQTVRLGVIPFGTLMPVGPLHGFYMYDDAVVFVELFTAELKLDRAGEVAAYQKVFDQLADVAVYGAQARQVITAALTNLQS